MVAASVVVIVEAAVVPAPVSPLPPKPQADVMIVIPAANASAAARLIPGLNLFFRIFLPPNFCFHHYFACTLFRLKVFLS